MPRPPLRVLAACAVLLLALSGCAAGAGRPAPDAGPAFPVVVPHAFGATTIGRAPRRVVTIGANDADFVTALGVQPLAERESAGDFAWQRRAWLPQPPPGPAPQVLSGTEPSPGQVAALRPDLILGVGSRLTPDRYAALSRIAPTVAAPTADGGRVPGWEEQTRITGHALGRDEQAERVIAATHREFDGVRRAHPEFAGARLSIVVHVEGTPYELGTEDPRAQLFTGLGFTVRPDTRELSPERQGTLDGDVVVVIGRSRAEALTDPAFAAAPAVREGRVAFPGGSGAEFAGALGYSSPLSLPYAIDAVVPQLAAALRDRAQGG